MAALFAGSAEMQAQSLGGLLKKAKNTIEKLGNADKPAKKTDNANPLGGGASNPIAQFVTIEPIGLYGVSVSEKTGNLYLVLKVTNMTEKSSMLLGSSIQNQKMLAVDHSGKVYNIDSSGAFRYDTPQDIEVKVALSEPGLQFVNVSKDLDVMKMVKVGVNVDASRQGNLTFTNVPIYWDEYPE